MLRKLFVTTAIVFFSNMAILTYAQPGFQDRSTTPAVSTVEQAKAARDDTPALIRGHIIERVKGDEYLFKDATGTIRVDIDHDKWGEQTITPETLVEIWGEVDKDWNSVEIDVRNIRTVQ